MPTPKHTQSHSSIPLDIVLLLRADAEQSWLDREVIPVLRQIETLDPLPEDQAGAALAYLENSWNEALLRARQTDAARDLGARGRETGLSGEARRYHTSVRALRRVVAKRVGAYVDLARSNEPACARIA